MKEFKCKDCIHYCVCKDTVAEDNWTDDTPIEIREIFSPKYCENFFLATDIAPVVHGKWVYDYWCEFKCSECGQLSNSIPFKAQERYCPNCGTRMDKEN